MMLRGLWKLTWIEMKVFSANRWALSAPSLYQS